MSRSRHFVLGVCLAVAGVAAASVVARADQAQAAAAAVKASPDLVNSLAKEIGGTPEQAAGAAGALFRLAKTRLKPDEFSQVSKAVPGMDALLAAAPALGGGAGGALSKATGGAAGLAAATQAFTKLGLKPEIAAETPTTEGVIASLRSLDLTGRSVGVQLYGTEPNLPLQAFLEEAGARVTTVAPYIYADAAADEAVRDLLARMAAGGVDAIAFTSTPQVERLFAVGSEELVRTALEKTQIAAVGPVVADALSRHGIRVKLMPHDSYFMKPLTATLESAFGKSSIPPV